MNPFKAGQTVRCTARDRMFITFGKDYTISEVDGKYVFVTDNDGDRGMYVHTTFEVVACNGVDATGVPKQLNVSDLQPFQRVVLTGGQTAIVSMNGEGKVAFTFEHGSYCSAEIECASVYSRRNYNVAALYAAPSHSDALNFNVKGTLLWKAVDAAKEAAIKEADAAIEAAKEAVAKAEAARKALN